MTDIEQYISKKSEQNYNVQLQKFLYLLETQTYHTRGAHIKLSTLEFLNKEQLENAKRIAQQLADSPDFTIFNQEHRALLALTPQGLLSPVEVKASHKYPDFLKHFGVKIKYYAENPVDQLKFNMQAKYKHYSPNEFADYLAQEFVNKDTNVIDISDKSTMYRNAMQEILEPTINGITATFDKTTPKVQISKA